jgi:signal transduction histidine kinase
MNLFEIAAFTAACVNFALALFVVWQNPKAPLHRAYFIWGLGVVLWNASVVVMISNVTPETALAAAKLLQFGIIIAPLGLFSTSLLVAEKRIPKVVFGGFCALHCLFAGSLFTNWFITGVRRIPHGYWSMPGSLFWVYTASYTALIGGSIMVLYRAQRDAPPLQRIRTRAMLAAIICIAVAGTNDLLPILNPDNVPTYPFTRIPFYPLGSIAACIYMTIVAYSVLQHRLLDVHVTLSRMVAHFIRVTFIMLVGLCQLLVISNLVPDSKFSKFAFFVALGVLGASAVIASVFFPRLFGASGTETFERKLLGDSFEYQDQVRSFISNMTWYTDIYPLFNDLHELLTRVFRLRSYQIILRDETSRVFTVDRAHPEQTRRQLPELRSQSGAFRFFEWKKSEYLTLNSSYLRPRSSVIERQAIEQLAEFGGEFCFPLTSQNEPFGLLIVGEKTTGEPYTSTDINLLVALVKNMSLMVNQIRLKNHILQTQELDLLGRMSRGMAHDLNNLLTPIWTLLQLSSETTEAGGPAIFDEELLPSALRNLTSMRAYIKEALFFSENLRPDFQIGRLDVIVKQAADQARLSRKKPVQVIAETPGEITAEMDEVLIQRLIANVISNAIDASPEGSTIRVELVRLAKTEANRDWLRVRVIDQGEGIRKEDLNRVFTPYFTTKTHGDEARGFGLGLAICRKIMNLHGGNLSVHSQIKKGTTVELDLPTRQVTSVAAAVAQPA